MTIPPYDLIWKHSVNSSNPDLKIGQMVEAGKAEKPELTNGSKFRIILLTGKNSRSRRLSILTSTNINHFRTITQETILLIRYTSSLLGKHGLPHFLTRIQSNIFIL